MFEPLAGARTSVGLALDAPESRFPLNPSGAEPLPDLSEVRIDSGMAPFAFRFLVPVVGTGGIRPEDISYDHESQTGVYEDLPPGVYMTSNPPKTYGPTQPSGQMDAPDDPGSSDD
jgi:putative ATP-grasp target RiPP